MISLEVLGGDPKWAKSLTASVSEYSVLYGGDVLTEGEGFTDADSPPLQSVAAGVYFFADLRR